MRTGIFTTLRVVEGRLWNEAWHRQRLLQDAEQLEAMLPELATYVRTHLDAAFQDAASRALKQPDSERWMARLVFEAHTKACSHRAEVQPARRQPWHSDARTLQFILRPDPRPASELRVKWLERDCFAAIESEAVATGADGVVLHGPRGLHEGTWFHIVALIDELWWSPDAAENVIYGATRAAFFEAAHQAGEFCKGGDISLAHLKEAEAVFALSSLLGGAPVSRIGALEFPESERCWRQRPWMQTL